MWSERRRMKALKFGTGRRTNTLNEVTQLDAIIEFSCQNVAHLCIYKHQIMYPVRRLPVKRCKRITDQSAAQGLRTAQNYTHSVLGRGPCPPHPLGGVQALLG